MEARKVTSMRGWYWVVEGFALYRKNIGMWIAISALYIMASGLVAQILPIAMLLLILLAQVFNAGFMLASRDLDRGKALTLRHLIAGFGHNPAQLVTIGGFFLVGLILISGIAMYAGAGALFGAIEVNQMHGGDPTEAMIGAKGAAAISLLAVMLLLVPLMMLILFAPALIVFHGMTAMEAAKQSFIGCLRNFPAFSVYGLALGAVGLVLGTLFALLGISEEIFMVAIKLLMVLLLPLTNTSIYAGYKDIFPVEVEAEAVPEAEQPALPD